MRKAGIAAAGVCAALAVSLASLADAYMTTTLHGSAKEQILPGEPGSSLLELGPWLTTYDSDAVCNDGTPAGYYISAGTTNQWIVFLEGGYWCWDQTSCQERYQTGKFSMSSDGWSQYMAVEGILGSGSNNPFQNAHKVFVKYCSSDSWFGDAGASAQTFGYSFRGARIVQAVMTALVQAHGLGSAGSADVLLAGCSAGGRGVLTNLDAFANAAPDNVNVRGFMDAALWVPVQPDVPDMLSLMNMTEMIYKFSDPPNIPSACLNAHPDGEWRCVWPSTRIQYVQTPYFLNAAQFDAFQIMYDSDNLKSEYCCTTPAQQSWAEQFQTETLAALGNVPSNDGVFSSTCLVHCLSSASDFYTFEVDGQTLSQALSAWYFQGQNVRTISSCDGWHCTEQCSGGPWQPSNTPCQTTTNQCVNDYASQQGANAPSSAQAVYQEQQAAAQIASEEAVQTVKQSFAQQDGSNWAQLTPAQQAKEVAAEKSAAAQAAGNAAWNVQLANAKAQGGNAVWALENAPPQQQQQQQGNNNNQQQQNNNNNNFQWQSNAGVQQNNNNNNNQWQNNNNQQSSDNSNNNNNNQWQNNNNNQWQQSSDNNNNNNNNNNQWQQQQQNNNNNNQQQNNNLQVGPGAVGIYGPSGPWNPQEWMHAYAQQNTGNNNNNNNNQNQWQQQQQNNNQQQQEVNVQQNNDWMSQQQRQGLFDLLSNGENQQLQGQQGNNNQQQQFQGQNDQAQWYATGR